MRYVELSACTKREQELIGIKVDTVLKAEADGAVKLGRQENLLTAETGSDL